MINKPTLNGTVPADAWRARRADQPPAGPGTPALGIRVDATNPDHHIWLNNGTWYIHYTVYPTPLTAERVRASLHTKDVVEARRRRDELFRRLAVGPDTANADALPLAA